MAPHRVLLTRPLADSRATAEALTNIGIESIAAPLIEIEQQDENPSLADVQAVLITSANGVRALASQVSDRSLPVFAVGDASARMAKNLGFTAIESAAGNIGDLAALVSARLNPTDGALLHPAGSAIAGDLAARLSPHGFDVRRYVAYTARAVEALPQLARAALAENSVEAVLLYSPRTAALFRTLVNAANLTGACRKLDAFCLSSAVAEQLPDLVFRRIGTARRPDQEAMLAMLLEMPDIEQ